MSRIFCETWESMVDGSVLRNGCGSQSLSKKLTLVVLDRPTSRKRGEKWGIHLLAHLGRHSGLAGLFLQIIQSFLGVVDGLLFLGNLLFVLGVFLVPCSRTAQAIAGVGIEGGGAQTILALGDIQFTRQQIDLALLIGNLLLPFVVGFLFVGGVRLLTSVL